MDARERHEFHDLLSKLVDGPLPEEQERHLGLLLEQHPELQELYLDFFELHAELSLTGGLTDPVTERPPEAVSRPSARTPSLRFGTGWGLLSGAAVASVLAIAIWLLSSSPILAPSLPIIARLDRVENARWAYGPVFADDGGSLAPGRAGLDEGTARIQMVSGVELVLQAPMVIELVDNTTVRLEQGNLTVSVLDESVGFCVLTPMAHLVDIGTEFGVEVEESGTTEVHVFHGVVVAKSTASGSVVPIAAQEAGRIDAPRDHRDLTYGEFVSVKLDRSRFGGLSTSAGEATFASDTRGPRRTFQRLPDGARILFLGDHATSRETHLLLINQALGELPPETAPQLFNAAWALPLSFDERQYREYVDSFAPSHAVLEFGPEIAGSPQPRPPEEFRQAITRLVDRLEQSGVEPIIATGFAIRKDPRAEELLGRYNEILRELAVQRGYRLADVDTSSRRRPDSEARLVGTYFAPAFEGFRVMAATLLESFGYPEIQVPQSLEVSLLPGVITDWRMRLVPDCLHLDAESVVGLTIDETWTRLTLPQQDEFSRRLAIPGRSFVHCDRARGFATHLTDVDRQIVQAISYCKSESDRDVYFNTGARLMTIWLNGEKIFESDNPWAGWHPGKERVPARLRAGSNQVVIESQDAFFLSITDQREWALPRPKVAVGPRNQIQKQ